MMKVQALCLAALLLAVGCSAQAQSRKLLQNNGNGNGNGFVLSALRGPAHSGRRLRPAVLPAQLAWLL